MEAVCFSEHTLCLTIQCKIPEETFSYSNKTPRHLLSLNNLYSSPNICMFCSNQFHVFSAVADYFVLLLLALCNFLEPYKCLTLYMCSDIRECLSLTIPNIRNQYYKPLFLYLKDSLAMKAD
jgi:hypothetical protein